LKSLQKLWKSDCQKEEDISYNRWRYTETWLLDYARTYGRETMKIKSVQQTTRRPKQKSDSMQQVTTASYASVIDNNTQSQSTGSRNQNRNQPMHDSENRSYLKTNPSHTYARGITGRYANTQRNNNHVQSKQRRIKWYRPPNIYRSERTTFIGRGVRHHFLGGGKPDQGQKHIPKPHHQTVLLEWR
jgi:hypothetical protein